MALLTSNDSFVYACPIGSMRHRDREGIVVFILSLSQRKRKTTLHFTLHSGIKTKEDLKIFFFSASIQHYSLTGVK